MGVGSLRFTVYLGNATINRLKSHNEKFKDLVSHIYSIFQMFESLLKLNERKKKECDFAIFTAEIKHRYAINDLSDEPAW